MDEGRLNSDWVRWVERALTLFDGNGSDAARPGTDRIRRRLVREALRLGVYLESIGDPRQARETFTRVLAIDESNQSARAALDRLETREVTGDSPPRRLSPAATRQAGLG